MRMDIRKFGFELLKAFAPPVVIFLWGYFFWGRITAAYEQLTVTDITVPIIILVAFAALDLSLFLRIRFSGIILAAYIATAAAWAVLLSTAPQKVASSNLIGLYATMLFLGFRAAAQISEATALHWKRHLPVETDLAVTSVLIHDAAGAIPKFILVKNENINSGIGLWVSPGGRWDPNLISPERRLIEKIESEVNYKVRLAPLLRGIQAIPDNLNSTDSYWYSPPDFLLYERLGSGKPGFAVNHLDFVYVCVTDGAPANRRPKYGPGLQVFVPVADCAGAFDLAFNAVSKAVDDWYLRNTGQRPSRRIDISDDIIWRIHFTAKAYHGNQKKAT